MNNNEIVFLSNYHLESKNMVKKVAHSEYDMTSSGCPRVWDVDDLSNWMLMI